MIRKVFINGRFLTQRVTGVQRYAREVLLALDDVLREEQSADLVVELLAPPGTSLPTLRSIRARCVGPLKGNLWEQVTLPSVTRGELLFSFCPTGPLIKNQQVITIHDASVYAVPEAFSWRFRAWYYFLLGSLAKRVPHVVTVSEFSRSEIVRYYGCKNSQVSVVVEGWQHLHRATADASILHQHGLQPNRYVLAVSSPTPNKNFALIVEAMKRLTNPDFDVAIAGSLDAKVFGRAAISDAPFVKRLGYVSDGELRALYENAGVFVYPSFYEGFGIPAIEAMASGCPVIASNAGSLPEVCGDAALYVSPHDAAALAATISRLMSDREDRERHATSGKARIMRYSWRAAALTNLACIRECLANT